MEDDPQLRKIVRRYLTSWGFTLLEAPSGVAALELVRDHTGPIDLMLTDLVMPGGIDGRTLSRRVLVDRPQMKVVFMSGYAEHVALNHAEIGPDDHFVEKPFTVQSLSDAVHGALGERPTIGGRVNVARR